MKIATLPGDGIGPEVVAQAVIFRPGENASRLARTAAYLGMPVPSEELFVQMCLRCVDANREFLAPYGHDAAMYLRPLMMGPE